MLHEILIALLGIPGSFIKQKNNQFVPESSLLSPAELQLLQKIVSLGLSYQALNSYCQNAGLTSIYLEELLLCVEIFLENYRNQIAQIEKKYLQDEVFTLSGLWVDLTEYFVSLPSLVEMIRKLTEDNLQGGQILSYMYQQMYTGNNALFQIYQQIFIKIYQLFFKQLYLWLSYGQIVDDTNEFFIYSIDQSNNNPTIQWDNVYSLRPNMIPYDILTLKQAEKILFIGKATLVLQIQSKYTNKDQIQLLIKQLQQFDLFTLNNIVDSLSQEVGSQLLQYIRRENDLLGCILKLKSYYLMKNGEFFQSFLEEARKQLELAANEDTLKELNSFILFNTFERLQEQKDLTKVKWILSPNGFEFKGFQHIQGLVLVGDIIQTQKEALRFLVTRIQKEIGALWHPVKQNVN